MPEDPFSLTKGQRQRVALASVLAMKPRVLVLTALSTARLQGPAINDGIDPGTESSREHHRDDHPYDVGGCRIRPSGAVATGGRLIADAGTRAIFADEELLAQAEVRPPQITQLANRLGIPPCRSRNCWRVPGGELADELVFIC